MKEFPDQSDLEFFVGCSVSNVILQPYSIDFQFDDASILVAEHLVEHLDVDQTLQQLDPQKGYESNKLNKIVNRLVTSVVRQPFSLTLHFDNGHAITITSRRGRFESGYIRSGKEHFIF
jgi:hypothetical protein